MHPAIAGAPFLQTFCLCSDLRSTESECLLFLFLPKVPKEVQKWQQPAVACSITWGSCVCLAQWEASPGGLWAGPWQEKAVLCPSTPEQAPDPRLPPSLPTTGSHACFHTFIITCSHSPTHLLTLIPIHARTVTHSHMFTNPPSEGDWGTASLGWRNCLPQTLAKGPPASLGPVPSLEVI